MAKINKEIAQWVTEYNNYPKSKPKKLASYDILDKFNTQLMTDLSKTMSLLIKARAELIMVSSNYELIEKITAHVNGQFKTGT